MQRITPFEEREPERKTSPGQKWLVGSLTVACVLALGWLVSGIIVQFSSTPAVEARTPSYHGVDKAAAVHSASIASDAVIQKRLVRIQAISRENNDPEKRRAREDALRLEIQARNEVMDPIRAAQARAPGQEVEVLMEGAIRSDGKRTKWVLPIDDPELGSQ